MANNFLILFFIVSVWFIMPIISILLFIWFLNINDRYNNFRTVFIILLISISIGLISFVQSGTAGKLFDTDIERYYITYDQYTKLDFKTFIITRFLSNPNVIFDFITYFIAQAFPDRPETMSLFWMSTSYFLGMLSILIIVKESNLISNRYFRVLIFIYIFIFSNYTFGSDLIKQSVATSLFAFSIANKIIGKKKISIIFLILAILTHSSALILSPIFLFGKRINEYRSFQRIIVLALGFLLLSNLTFLGDVFLSTNIRYLTTLGEKAELISNSSGIWRIHYLHIIGLLMFALMLWYLGILMKNFRINFRQYKLIIRQLVYMNNLNQIAVLTLFMLIVNIFNTHNFLRYFNTISVFYLFPLIIFNFLKRANIFKESQGFNLLLSNGYVIFFALYSFLNFYNRTISPSRSYGVSIMNNDLITILTSNVYQFLNYYN